MRKIIAHIATSADGFIARPDGNVDWLNRPSPKGKYGFAAFLKSIDAVIWGRTTWVKGQELGGGLDWCGPDVKHYVFSRDPQFAADRVEVVNEPVDLFAKRLRSAAGKNIWMMGGANIIGAFLDAGGIDEFSIHVIPVFIGEGIPLIAPRHREVELDLIATRRFSDGSVRLHYRVSD